MPDKDDDFSSLFDDKKPADSHKQSEKPGSLNDEISSFINDEDIKSDETSDDIISHEIEPEITPHVDKNIKNVIPREELPGIRKRSSLDFEPDMDALLLTAQSSMIIEGMKYLLNKDYSTKTLPIYSEAVKGIELYIKILDRNPNNYKKLANIIIKDLDCKEVEKIAFNLYESTFREKPDSDDKRIRAYEILKDGLMTGYNKVLISKAMGDIKKYFTQSGAMDEHKINILYKTNDHEFKHEISSFNQFLKLSVDLIKTGKGEITKGMKGRDLNVFIIRLSEILAYYCNISGKLKEAQYFKRLMDNHKNYFVIR